MTPPAANSKSERPTLLIRADGGPELGAGHLARCFALAETWVHRGGLVVLSSVSPPRAWRNRYEQLGARLHEPGVTRDGDWAVLDGHHLGLDDQEAAKVAASRLVVIDDHGAIGDYVSDVVLDQNLDASPDAYSRRRPDTDLLLGTRYALLRREFQREGPMEREIAPVARRLLVALGGFPSRRLTELVDDVLRHPPLDQLDVTILDGEVQVAEAMARADLALSTAGTTCWELCRMGLPAVLIAVAGNQEPLAGAMATHGAALYAGRVEELDPRDVASTVGELARSAETRRRMAERGARLVDGRGAGRVVARLRADLLTLRRVNRGDARLLWDWANDPATRAMAFSPEAIPWEDHVAWLNGRLADSDAHLYVATAPDGAPLGQVRFERAGCETVISVSVDPRCRSHGWGGALIDAGVRQVFGDSGVDSVIARIKPDNLASLAAFEDADFVSEGESTDETHRWLQYRRDASRPCVK